MTARLDFLVDRQDLSRTCWEETEIGTREDLAPGEICIRHERFAFTANNVTYAHGGETFGYWNYFPAADNWGSIPVWGIGTIAFSRHPEISEGERIYGYFPMSSHLRLCPEGIKAHGFLDASTHRVDLPRTYNEYIRIDRDPSYDPASADAHLVLRPLFSLSFFLAHFLADAGFFGARNAIISSASSKAATGLAFEIRRLAKGNIAIVGITNAAKVDFVARSGHYDRVIAYPEIAALSECSPSLYVDIAGDDSVLTLVHKTLKADLTYSCRAGMTHGVPNLTDYSNLPGPAPEFFFTPKHILARRESWGPDELRRRLALEWQAFIAQARTWLTIECSSGKAAVEQVYAAVLNGKRPPDRADILSFETT